MIGSPGGVARTIGLRVRKNAKPGTSEGLAYIIVKMLAVPLTDVTGESHFEVSDPAIARIEDGQIIGLKAGRTSLKVTYNGYETTAIVDVY